MPVLVYSLSAGQIQDAVRHLFDNLVKLRDETGEFLPRLDDGRVIDTKGWNDWGWTHAVGLYGIFKHWELSSGPAALAIMKSWFRDPFKPDYNAPALPEEHRIVEHITGWPYAKLWGRNTMTRPKNRTVST